MYVVFLGLGVDGVARLVQPDLQRPPPLRPDDIVRVVGRAVVTGSEDTV